MNRTLALAGLALAGTLGLAACGSSSTTTGSSATAQPSASGYGLGGPGAPGRQFHFPGTVGKIAEVDGRTLQVQGTSGQTAVTYTGSTIITAQVSTSLKDVTVGSCVTVTPTSSTTPDATTVTAASVRITAATKGSCLGGFAARRAGGAGSAHGFGGAGLPAGGRPSGMPSFNPSDRPSGFGSQGRRFRIPTSGKVTAVSADGFTVATTRYTVGSGSSPSTTTSDVAVKVTSSTSYTTTRKADGSALKTGQCVTAIGSTSDTGAVQARSLAVSAPVSGSCTSSLGGFGGFGGFGRG